MNKPVAIIGHGTVGKAMSNWFSRQNQPFVIYDPGQGHEAWEVVSQCDIVFVCVPTPMAKDGSCDTSIVKQVVDKLSQDGPKIVVIRSTVDPGTTKWLQLQWSPMTLIFMPEFLSEDSAQKDFDNPDRHILGFADRIDPVVAKQVLSLLPALAQGGLELVTGSTEAELIKYFANCWYAVKVSFANQMHDMSHAIGADYEVVRKAASADPMCGPSHLDVHHKGYRGYGGKCLPKDVSALLFLADLFGVDMSVIEAARLYNDKLIASQGK